MATYRNRSNETLTCVTGFTSPRTVAPDETLEVPDELIENYDLNENFVRVGGSTPPAADAPASEDEAE